MEVDVFASSDTSKPGGEKAKSKHSKLKREQLVKGLQEISGRLNKLIEENKQLKKDYANEQCRGNQERAEKVEEQNRRQQLEKENHDLKAEISSCKKNGHVKDDNEIQLLKDRLLEVKGELERQKKFHSMEKMKLENESKKIISDKMKAVEALKLVKNEKIKVEDDRKLIERKSEEYRLCLEKAKFEIKELTEKLNAEILKTEDFKKKFESEKLKMVEKVRADLHKKITAEQKRSIDVEQKKTNEEKAHVERLTRALEEEKLIREKLQKKIEDFESSSKRKRGNCNAKNIHGRDSSVTNENTALLRKMCKLLKKQAKHAEKKTNPEKIYIVQEPQFLQQSLMDLSDRVNLLDARLAHSIEGIDVLTETRIPQETNGVKKKNVLLDDKMTKCQPKKECPVTRICCSGNAPISELASTEPHKGTNNPQISAICSNTSYSDIRSMRSKERDPRAARPSTNIKFKRPNKRPASINLSIDTPKITENKKVCILANNVQGCHSYKEHVCSSKRQKIQDSGKGEKTSAVRNDNPQQDKRNMQINMEPQSSRNELDDLITFEKLLGGSCLKLLDVDSSTEDKYRKAVEMPISPTLPSLEAPKHQLQVQDDTQCVMEKDKPLMNNIESNTSFVATEHNETPEAVNTTFEFADNAPIARKLHTAGQNMVPTGITLQGDIHVPTNSSKQSALCCVVHPNIKDKDTISRIICMKNAFSCQNIITVSQIGHLIVQVHNVIARNATFTPQEKGSILLSSLICNISSLISVDLKPTPSKDLLPCFKLSVEINTVVFSAQTLALFEEICHIDVLTSLLEDFLIEKRSLVYCDKLYGSIDTSTVVSQLYGTDILSEPATFDQYIAGCIILASISGVANRVGFLLQTSYKILRMCRTEDASWVLAALHIFAVVNRNNCVALDEHKFLVVVLNSMVRLIESTRVPATDFSNLSHYKECPFATNALCMEKIAILLLDALQCFIGRGVKDDNTQISNYFSVSTVHGGENDVFGGSSLLFTYIKHDDGDDISFGFLQKAYCHISDVASLLELVGCYMSLEWTCNNILPRILKMLESCTTEGYLIVLLNLIGQLGRFGVEVSGHESNRLPKLRDAISVFVDSANTKKNSLQTQFAAVNSLVNLLPFTLKEIIDKHQHFHPDINLSNYVKAIKSWFSGLSDQNQSLCFDFLDQVNIVSR